MKEGKISRTQKIAIGVVGAIIVITILWTGFYLTRNSNDEWLSSLLNERKELSPSDNPNIIFIMVDDMGYGDLSSYGATLIDTPNIDALAENGAMLTNYFAPAPVCTPSRAACLTGRYSIRSVPDVLFPTGTYYNSVDGIPEEEILISEALQENGYATGMLGKWHLGDQEGYLPNDNGFDFFYGALYSNDMDPYAIYRNKEIEIESPADQTQLTKNFTTEAINFITENQDNPFFLYYAQPFPHDPAAASDDYRGSSGAGVYGDSIQEIDWSVGEIVSTLEELGIADNTLIVFTSDNGPWYEGSAGSLQGRKGQVWSGGQKVPFIAYWPDGIAANTTIDAMSMGIDLFPTFMEITGTDLPDDRIIDGESIWSLLSGETTESPHDILYFIQEDTIMGATDGVWKYQRSGTTSNAYYYMLEHGPYLYNFVEDIGESYNLIDDYQDIADEFESTIQSFERVFKTNPSGID